MRKRILGKRQVRFWLLLGFLLSIFALNASVTKSDDSTQTTNNLIASHDSASTRYDKNCANCHSNIPAEKSLNPSVPNAHSAMLPYTPGKENNKKCIWCHRSVDLVQGATRVENSKGNLRKGVNMTLCALCHSPAGPGKQFFQTDSLPTPPDGRLLYDLVCAACHRDLANSQVKGESASEIQKKINENEGGMGPLKVLSSEEIQAIANALAQ